MTNRRTWKTPDGSVTVIEGPRGIRISADLSLVEMRPEPPEPPDPEPEPPEGRLALTWPAPATSIRHVPVHTDAELRPCRFAVGDLDRPLIPETNYLTLHPAAQGVDVVKSNAGFGHGAQPACDPDRWEGVLLRDQPMPPDWRPTTHVGHNGAADLIQRDRRTMRPTQPFGMCTDGTPYSYWLPGGERGGWDLYEHFDEGGAQGGSGMDGGLLCLRHGELVPLELGGLGPPTHCINVTLPIFWLWAGNHAKGDKRGGPGFEWPAFRRDRNQQEIPYSGSGPHPGVQMGSRLVLPMSFPVEGLATEPMRMLAWSLQRWGLFVVDSAPGINNLPKPGEKGWHQVGIGVEESTRGSFETTFAEAWGHPFSRRGPTHTAPEAQREMFADWVSMLAALCRVHDTHSTMPGGPGEPVTDIVPPPFLPDPAADPPYLG